MKNGIQTDLLNGIKVLELTYGPSGSYAGRLFAECGAQVTKVSADFHKISAFRDTKKQIIQTTGTLLPNKIQEVLEWGHWNIVLFDSHMSDDLEKLLKPMIQHLPGKCFSVQIKFPLEVDCNEEAAMQAIGGWCQATGDPEREPLSIAGYPAAYLIGAHAATAGMFALLERKQQKREVIVDALTVVASALEGSVSNYMETGEVRNRAGNRHHGIAPMAIFPAQDGYAFIGAPTDDHWDLLTRWIGVENRKEWRINEGRLEHYAKIESMLREWTAVHPRHELFETGQAFRMPCSKVQTPEELETCPQLRSRRFFTSNSDGRTIQAPWKVLMGQSNGNSPVKNERYPKEKLRILDLTSMWSGPYCSRLFADQGAEVIKVEAPHRPDGIRASQENRAPFFRELNRNKKAVTLDLRTPEDREVLLGLAASSDVLIENFSPRVMRNFGLTPDVFWKRNDSLIYLSLSAFGQTGPYSNFVGYGPTLEAMSGIASLTHYENGMPWLPGFSVSDIASGIHAAFILAASLYFNSKKRVGLTIDVAQYETAIQFIGDYIIEGTRPNAVGQTLKFKTVQDFEALRLWEGPGSTPTLGPPWFSEGWEPKSPLAAPRLGEHNHEFKLAKRQFT